MNMVDSRKILFICRGNIGRSQAAAAFYNQLGLGEADSAGTLLRYPDMQLKDNGVADNVIAAMKSYGVDLSDKIPRLVSDDDLNKYDKFIVMAEPHTIPEWLVNSPKTEIWTVPDPKGQDIETTLEIFNQIRERVKTLNN